MKCTGQELYNALTQKDMIQIFTGSEAKMKDSAEPGGNFELLGGNITMKFYKRTPNWLKIRLGGYNNQF